MKKYASLLLVSFYVLLSVLLNVYASADEVDPGLIDPIVGELTIFASNDGGSSSSIDISGHAFLMYKNTSSSSVQFGAVNVRSGASVTIGTWGNQAKHTGIWYNLESYFVNN